MRSFSRAFRRAFHAWTRPAPRPDPAGHRIDPSRRARFNTPRVSVRAVMRVVHSGIAQLSEHVSF